MKKIKRIAALTAVIAWGLLLLVTLITAFINTDSARTLFNGLIFTGAFAKASAKAALIEAMVLSLQTAATTYLDFLSIAVTRYPLPTEP